MTDPVIAVIDAGHYGDPRCRKDEQLMPCNAILEARKRRQPYSYALKNTYEPGKQQR